jgi:Holliday junction resolvase RusA-like endonuclease
MQLPLLAEVGALKVSSEVFCAFELQREPKAWERAGATVRFAHNRPYVHFYETADQAAYKEEIAWAARTALRGKGPTLLPVAVLVHAFLGIPVTWSERQYLDAVSGALRPHIRGSGDADNYAKVAADAMNKIVYEDDAQIVDSRAIKYYSERPALRIEVREFRSDL